ncbi:MAG: glycosyltransferase [Devosia sp.]
MPTILYLVHNLADPAVSRRVAMFRQGGADVEIAGFKRADAPPATLPLDTVVELDITHDGRMFQRLAATLRAAFRAPRWARSLQRPDIIVARNLEMLGVAQRLLGIWDVAPILVYECLDIHRLMLRQDRVGQGMRALEQRLMRDVQLVITSSPAFLRNYFDIHGAPPAHLVENKVFSPQIERFGRNPALTEEPGVLRIGWFGALRCQTSLTALDALTQRLGGRIQVSLAGRPALTEFADFHGTVASAPHLQFKGAFNYPDDLAALYSAVHFVWAIDFFEAGLNSSWLLPNRLYEGCLNGAIPIALAGTETAAFIERLGVGVVLPDIAQDTLVAMLESMTPDRVRLLAGDVATQQRSAFLCQKAECIDLVERLSLGAATKAELEVAA